MMKKWFLSAVVAVAVMGCQNKPCREIQAEKMAQKTNQEKNQGNLSTAQGQSANAPGTQATSAGDLKVKVYKPDGSLQCGMGTKIPLETMEKELKGIKVLSRANINDGLMRIQVCGAPTGQSNVYEINRTDLDKALKAGFKQWSQE